MSKPVLCEKPWDSDFGIVNVGDECVVITEGYNHRISLRRGVYLGYLDCGINYWNKKPNLKVKALVKEKKYVYFKKGTNIRCTWYDPDKEMREVEVDVKTTLQLNRIIPISKNTDPLSLVDNLDKLV